MKRRVVDSQSKSTDTSSTSNSSNVNISLCSASASVPNDLSVGQIQFGETYCHVHVAKTPGSSTSPTLVKVAAQ